MASFLPPEPKTPQVATPTPKQIKEYQNEVFLENERRIRDEELENLRLSDPEMYEELVQRGELEHAGEEPEGINP